MYWYNFILAIVLVAWIADSTFIRELPIPIKISLVCAVISTEMYLFDIVPGLGRYFARLFILNMGLMKLRVNNFKVLASMGLGLLMLYMPLTLCVYVGIMAILVVYYGVYQP